MQLLGTGVSRLRPGKSVCPYCGSGCAMLVSRADSHPCRQHPVSQGALCLRGYSAGELLGSPLRLRHAYARDRDGRLAPIAAESAIAMAADRLAGIRDRHGGESIGILGSARITVEEVVLLRRLARALGTPHLDTLQRVGYLPFPPLPFQAIEDAKRLTVLAANLTVRQPQVARRVLRAVDRGARLKLVHSRRAQLATLVAEHVVALPGHELEHVPSIDPDELVLLSSEISLAGQGAPTMAKLGGKRALFLTDYVNQRGAIEAGLHPWPDGLSAWEMLTAAEAGRLRALLVFADDPFEFFPALAAGAFARAELTMVVDSVRTPTAAHAALVIPGALLSEKHGTVVNAEGRAQEIAPVERPLAGWTEGGVATELMRRFDGDAEPVRRAPHLVPCDRMDADRPNGDLPFLAALDTTTFWNSHAHVAATVSAWREARNLFADFPPGCVTLNPDDARRLGIQYASAVTLQGEEGAVTLPARLHPRMLPGTAWVAMTCWERAGRRLGALAFDRELRVPVFVPRAVRVVRPRAS